MGKESKMAIVNFIAGGIFIMVGCFISLAGTLFKELGSQVDSEAAAGSEVIPFIICAVLFVIGILAIRRGILHLKGNDGQDDSDIVRDSGEEV